MTDASYRDAVFSDQPLRLTAVAPEDLAVISALVQDAVGRTGEMSWMSRRRRLAVLLNRFRWEDRVAAERDGRPYERVRAALLFDYVLAVRARGIDPSNRQAPLSLLRIDWQPDAEAGTADAGNAAPEGTAPEATAPHSMAPSASAGEDADGPARGVGGRILLALAGGGEVALQVECIDVRLIDLTRPWETRNRLPDHSLEETG